jgi:hypothetical protein
MLKHYVVDEASTREKGNATAMRYQFLQSTCYNVNKAIGSHGRKRVLFVVDERNLVDLV